MPDFPLPLLRTVILLSHVLYAAGRPEVPPFDKDCNRRLSREAVIILENDVYTVANVQNIVVSEQCRFNLENNRYGQQEGYKKEMKYGTWECGICKKQFRTEWFIDLHMHNKHAVYDTYLSSSSSIASLPSATDMEMDNTDNPTNTNEYRSLRKGICFADYCGILGCPSLQYNESLEHDHDQTMDMDEGKITTASEGRMNNVNTDDNDETGPDVSPSSSSVDEPNTGDSEAKEYGIANISLIHERKMNNEYSKLLSSKQQRERDRCSAIIIDCLPLPRKPLNLSSPLSAGPNDAESSFTDTNKDKKMMMKMTNDNDPEESTREKEEDDNNNDNDNDNDPSSTTLTTTDSSSNKYLRTQRTLSPEEEYQSAVQRIFEFRHQLIRDFCENSYSIKRKKAIQTIYKDSGSNILWYIIGLTVLIMIIFYGLVYIMEYNNDTTAKVIKKTSPGYRYNRPVPPPSHSLSSSSSSNARQSQPRADTYPSLSYSSSIRTNNTSSNIINRRNKETISIRTIGDADSESYGSSTSTSSFSPVSSEYTSPSLAHHSPHYTPQPPQQSSLSSSPSLVSSSSYVPKHRSRYIGGNTDDDSSSSSSYPQMEDYVGQH